MNRILEYSKAQGSRELNAIRALHVLRTKSQMGQPKKWSSEKSHKDYRIIATNFVREQLK